MSSIAAELDQKSCWEILTDAQFTQKYYSADERQVFRRHILWTRIVSDRKTTLPDGQTGSLLDSIRKDHERLVLKPNRSYGGTGVVLGHLLTKEEWDKAIDWLGRFMALVRNEPYRPGTRDAAQQLKQTLAAYRGKTSGVKYAEAVRAPRQIPREAETGTTLFFGPVDTRRRFRQDSPAVPRRVRAVTFRSRQVLLLPAASCSNPHKYSSPPISP